MPLPSGCLGKNLGFAQVLSDGFAKMQTPVFENEDVNFVFAGGTAGIINVGKLKVVENFVNTFLLVFQNPAGLSSAAPTAPAGGASPPPGARAAGSTGAPAARVL